MEGQIRWTRGAWSLGAGVQSTSNEQKGTDPFFSPGPDGLMGTSDDFDNQWDYDASTLGLFLEPRFVVAVFADRFGLYVFGRLTWGMMTDNESGTFPTALAPIGTLDVPTQAAPYSLGVTRTTYMANVGPGLLICLTSHVNLDLGVSAGKAWWGDDPDTDVSDLGFAASPFSNAFLLSPFSSNFTTYGAWVGIVIGIG